MSFAPYIAAHRFGLGAGVEEMQSIKRQPKIWLLNQLKYQQADPITAKLQSSDALTKKIGGLKQASQNERRTTLKKGYELYKKEMEARFRQTVSSQTPLLERLVLFWSNHFTVSAKGKPHLAWLVGAYEREAIRPHILGKFSDMLIAVTQHPAMLVYLDNIMSFGPNSLVGRKRKRGLNENLAREILELHTLGVNGGYTQEDVIGLAKIITGWTVKPARQGGGGYQFIQYVHEPGTHKLLGKSYSQKGESQGIAALNNLARHPSTARFIATKMAQHFISDTPPERCIKKLEKTFLNTGGDLRAMTETLINMKEVWAAPLPKVKTPYELVISTFRLTDIPPKTLPFERIAQSLALLEHVPFQATSPAGWPDTEKGWLSPNAMMNRVEWCHAIAQVIRPKENPLDIAKSVLAGVADPATLLWIERAPSPIEGAALLLASPEWQRR